MENITEFSNELILVLSHLVVSLFLFFLGKKLFSRQNVKKQLVDKDNLAFALLTAGYFIGILLCIGGAVIGESHGLWNDITALLGYGVLGIFLLHASVWVNDKWILSGFSVRQEILERGNPAAGIVVAASQITSGLLVFAAISGEIEATNAPLGAGAVTTLAYWIVGQIILVLTARLYRWFTPYDDTQAVKEKNLAVGIAYAGVLLSIGILLFGALFGNFVSWWDTMMLLLEILLPALVFLPLLRYLLARLLFGGRSYKAELIDQLHPNIGVGLLEAAVFVVGAVLLLLLLL